jgi:hypothetical protein
MHYTSEPLVVEQLHQLMELPEANKSSAADEPENTKAAVRIHGITGALAYHSL